MVHFPGGHRRNTIPEFGSRTFQGSFSAAIASSIGGGMATDESGSLVIAETRQP